MLVILVLLLTAALPIAVLFGAFKEPYVVNSMITPDEIFMYQTPLHIGFISIISFFVFVILCGIVLSSISRHFRNLSIIRREAQRILIVTETRDAIKHELDRVLQTDAKSISSIFANADTPIKQMIDNLVRAENAIADTKERIEESRRQVTELEIGFLWWVVKIWGKE